MAQQREAATDRLVGVIANIKIEHRSGQLRVRRGEGLTSEEGLLTFVQGQITQANAGRRNGADALNWLSTWGQTRYVFTSLTLDEKANAAFSPQSPLPESVITNPAVLAIQVNTDKLAWDEHVPTSGYETLRVTMELHEATTRIERAGLSRSHRRLYLLIDGHRAVRELVPLIGKQTEEVRSMLHDLEWLGVIQIAHFPPDSH